MKQSEIRELTTQELEERLVEEKTNLVKMKLAHNISPLENPMSIRAIRRDVSRVSSELRRRQIEG